MNIVVGVTGSIAAYKAIELIRLLEKQNHQVKVVMSQHATAFIQPLTFEALLGSKPIVGDKIDEVPALEHINLAKWCDVFVVAPATANFLAKARIGIADDFMLSFLLAFDGPVLIAPAMNTTMFLQEQTQENIKELEKRGCKIISPQEGLLACGDVGTGKLADLETIIFNVNKAIAPQFLEKHKIIITAGPTIEAIDPVRFLTNRSSGKMGFALAERAAMYGAEVTLVSGKVSLPTPPGVKRIDVTTTKEMLEVLIELLDKHEALIMAAAPADYTPVLYSHEKIKKQSNELSIDFKKNPDILKNLKEHKQKQIIVGFAAESQSLEDNAIIKLKEKGLDFIVANDISQTDTGFQSDFNKAVLIFPDGRKDKISKTTKLELSDIILKHLKDLL